MQYRLLLKIFQFKRKLNQINHFLTFDRIVVLGLLVETSIETSSESIYNYLKKLHQIRFKFWSLAKHEQFRSQVHTGLSSNWREGDFITSILLSPNLLSLQLDIDVNYNGVMAAQQAAKQPYVFHPTQRLFLGALCCTSMLTVCLPSNNHFHQHHQHNRSSPRAAIDSSHSDQLGNRVYSTSRQTQTNYGKGPKAQNVNSLFDTNSGNFIEKF